MKKLFLFDIDRTLIEGPPTNRFTTAIKNLHNLDIESKVEGHGLTEKQILAAILEQEGWTDEQIEESLPKLLEELEKVHKQSFKKGRIKVLPGVRELLEALQKRGVTLGLITGNSESISRRKLSDVNLWHYFSLGGYGNDPHITRSDLVVLAINRAGFAGAKQNVYVIGDTPWDILAAKQAGIENRVGVTNGYRPIQELINSGAKLVFEDLRNTTLLISKFGLE